MAEPVRDFSELKSTLIKAPEPEVEAEVAVVENQPKIDKQGRAYATGKRKDAVARVWVKPGPGRIIVNGRDEEVYFARPVLRMILRQPLVATARDGQFDVWCTVGGGGLSGQAGAVRHGISKALLAWPDRPLDFRARRAGLANRVAPIADGASCRALPAQGARQRHLV